MNWLLSVSASARRTHTLSLSQIYTIYTYCACCVQNDGNSTKVSHLCFKLFIYAFHVQCMQHYTRLRAANKHRLVSEWVCLAHIWFYYTVLPIYISDVLPQHCNMHNSNIYCGVKSTRVKLYQICCVHSFSSAQNTPIWAKNWCRSIEEHNQLQILYKVSGHWARMHFHIHTHIFCSFESSGIFPCCHWALGAMVYAHVCVYYERCQNQNQHI